MKRLLVADTSTLEALFRKLESLQEVPPGRLAGKICNVVDLVTHLPVQVWFNDNPTASDTQFESDLLQWLGARSLLLLDRGFYHFQFFADLMTQRVDFVTRLKARAAFDILSLHTASAVWREIPKSRLSGFLSHRVLSSTAL